MCPSTLNAQRLPGVDAGATGVQHCQGLLLSRQQLHQRKRCSAQQQRYRHEHEAACRPLLCVTDLLAAVAGALQNSVQAEASITAYGS